MHFIYTLMQTYCAHFLFHIFLLNPSSKQIPIYLIVPLKKPPSSFSDWNKQMSYCLFAHFLLIGYPSPGFHRVTIQGNRCWVGNWACPAVWNMSFWLTGFAYSIYADVYYLKHWQFLIRSCTFVTVPKWQEVRKVQPWLTLQCCAYWTCVEWDQQIKDSNISFNLYCCIKKA